MLMQGETRQLRFQGEHYRNLKFLIVGNVNNINEWFLQNFVFSFAASQDSYCEFSNLFKMPQTQNILWELFN